MARPSKEPLVSSPLVPALFRHVRSRGGDVSLFELRTGLSPSLEHADEAPIAPSALNDVLEAASIVLGEPDLALTLPSALLFRRYRFAEISARASASVREGLTRLARYAPLVVPCIEACVNEAAHELALHVRSPGYERGLGRHVHEYALSYALSYARRESGHAITATRVWFSDSRPRDLVPLIRFFGTRDLTFGADDTGFAIAKSDADLALAAHDERLLATVEALAEEELRAVPRVSRFEEFVAARVASLLPDASIARVSTALHMSGRTLQRRLEDEGARFSDVLDRVREERARTWMLDASLSLTEIAARLGFADLATFGRAFKRWTGTSPGSFRRG